MSVITSRVDGNVAVVEFSQPPNNFFDPELLDGILQAYVALATEKSCRAIVLCSAGKHFCAGANFRKPAEPNAESPKPQVPHLYDIALKLFEQPLPVIAALQGAVIGGGLGLALSADFRVVTAETRLTANFARVGLHQGFGMSVTLPRVVGQQHALDMLYTGRDVFGPEALTIGLVDRLVAAEALRAEAVRMAQELAMAAPLAVQSIRQTMRRELVDQIRAILERELSEQTWLRTTEDFKRGVAAKRGEVPQFTGT